MGTICVVALELSLDKGQLISKCAFFCLQFPPKKERKQVNLRLHSSKVEFVRMFFVGNVDLKKIISTLSDL